MTTCLLRIRWGKKYSIHAYYGKGLRENIPYLHDLKDRMKDWATLALDERPFEVVVEIPNDFLAIHNIEFVDSPGTGSARNRRYDSSLEDEIVDTQTRAAAISVLVYQLDDIDKEAHERIVYDVANIDAPTVAVCNLGPKWATALQSDKEETKGMLDKAEAFLERVAKAKCFKIVISDKEALEGVRSLASAEYDQTLDDLKNCIVKSLKSHNNLVTRQAVFGSRETIKNLLESAESKVEEYQPIFTGISRERANILGSISDVEEKINKGYARSSESQAALDTAIAGGFIGPVVAAVMAFTTGGMTIPLSIAWTAGSAATGGVVGAVSTALSNEQARSRFRQDLAIEWTRLQETLKNCHQIADNQIIDSALVNRVIKASSSLPLAQYTDILSSLKNDLNVADQKVDGFDTYR